MVLSEDSLPVISQLKSFILLCHCDTFGAYQTQITFSKQCIIISQIRSLIQWLILNDIIGAIQTQKEFYHETFLPFPIISQLISIYFIFSCDYHSSWRIQQKFCDKITNLLLFPIRLIYYIFNCSSSIGRVISTPNTSKYARWMSDNFSHLSLNQLVLPGTHNSHSYKFRRTISFAANISKCQHLSIYRQLLCGARCLDIRLCIYNNELWCAHGAFITIKFIDIIQQTVRFVKEYSDEIVIFRCKTEWDWRHKAHNPVMRKHIINDIKQCNDAINYFAPLNPDDIDIDIMNTNISELVSRKYNIIVFHEFFYGKYEMITSWCSTNHYSPKQLIYGCKKWINSKVEPNYSKKLNLEYFDRNNNDVDIDGSIESINTDLDNKLYLVNGQITPVLNCQWTLYALITGIRGLSCDVELVNAQMIKHIKDKELYKLNVWDMDFLHPLLVQKIIETNLKYCNKKIY